MVIIFDPDVRSEPVSTQNEWLDKIFMKIENSLIQNTHNG